MRPFASLTFAWSRQHAEAFMRLSQRPAEAQVDFGYASVILNGGRVQPGVPSHRDPEDVPEPADV
jgi:hypothetical protein